jgi:hypothetical protein
MLIRYLLVGGPGGILQLALNPASARALIRRREEGRRSRGGGEVEGSEKCRGRGEEGALEISKRLKLRKS